MDKNMTLEKRIAAELYCYQGRMSVFVDDLQGHTVELGADEEFETASTIKAFLLAALYLQDEMHVRIKSFGHAGDGNLHVYILRDDLDEEAWEKVLNDTMEKMYAKARTMDGKVSGEHGIGFAKKPYLNEERHQLQNLSASSTGSFATV